jgi:tetratricopeptide (TPR) repeat protein
MVAIVETPEAALQWNLTALELATTSEMRAARKWRKSLHNNLGWTFYDLQQFDIALYHFKKCQELALENNDAEFERIARWCIAKVLRVQGNLDEALSMQFGQLAELEKVGRTSGFVFEELAECLYALGRADQAAPFFDKAYQELSKDPWISEEEPDRMSRLKELSV